MENSKNNKKKLFAIFLFLSAFSVSVGFGAYSYYWTQGSYETEEETINIIAFNPQMSSNGSQFFLGDGATLELTCDNSNRSTGSDTVTCSTSAIIINDGGTGIILSVEDAQVNVNAPDGISVDYSDATFEFGNSYLDAGESTSFSVVVPISVDNGTENGDGGDYPEEVYSSVAGGDVTVSVSLKLVATQDY